jgi:hypothetical protein
MNYAGVLLWGFAATVILTTIMSGSRWLRFTRMDIPFLLGTMFTSNRQRAIWIGFLIHMMIGWLFAFIYALAFENTALFFWWFGVLIGIVHASFVLFVGLPLVENFHPRMATEDRGPEPTLQLEPPGFLILNYGRGTPIATLLSHMIYGGILGYFYY